MTNFTKGALNTKTFKPMSGFTAKTAADTLALQKDWPVCAVTGEKKEDEADCPATIKCEKTGETAVVQLATTACATGYTAAAQVTCSKAGTADIQRTKDDTADKNGGCPTGYAVKVIATTTKDSAAALATGLTFAAVTALAF